MTHNPQGHGTGTKQQTNTSCVQQVPNIAARSFLKSYLRYIRTYEITFAKESLRDLCGGWSPFSRRAIAAQPPLNLCSTSAQPPLNRRSVAN